MWFKVTAHILPKCTLCWWRMSNIGPREGGYAPDMQSRTDRRMEGRKDWRTHDGQTWSLWGAHKKYETFLSGAYLPSICSNLAHTSPTWCLWSKSVQCFKWCLYITCQCHIWSNKNPFQRAYIYTHQ